MNRLAIKTLPTSILNLHTGGAAMKGYYTPSGYMGYVPSENSYMLFASEADYIDYVT